MAAVVALVLAACGTDDASNTRKASCASDEECEAGTYCGDEGVCVADCGSQSENVTDCPTGQTCTSAGRCTAGGACAADADCDSAPEAFCDGDTVVTYAAAGKCESAEGQAACSYAETRTPCEGGCSEGQCEADLCEEQACDTPPEASCLDANTRVTYEGEGFCGADGQCTYTQVEQSCAQGCDGGECASAPCETVTCDSAPDDRCEDNLAMRFGATGTCVETDEAGTFCDYPVTFEHCSYTGASCQDAQCVNAITQAGGIVITEFMADPVASFADRDEWFEVVNTGADAVDLQGWTIRSGSDELAGEAHVIGESVVIGAGERALLAKNDTVGDGLVVPDYRYDDPDVSGDSITLKNSSDWLSIIDPLGHTVDYVFWEPGSILDGRSRKLDPSVALDPAANDDFANWCPSLSDPYGGEPFNYGTPGVENTPCAADPCAEFTCERPSDYCRGDSKAVQYQLEVATCQTSRFNNPYCDFEPTEVECTATELCAFGRCEEIPANVPAAGDLVITEVMADAAGVDSDREWFEIYNTTAGELSLFGMTFQDVNDTSTDRSRILDIKATIGAGQYLVFAHDSDPLVNGGLPSPVIVYSGSQLKNGPASDFELELVGHDGTSIDRAPMGAVVESLGGGSFPTGVSLQVAPATVTAVANDDVGNWCEADAVNSIYGDGGAGTPGAANVCAPN